MHGWPLFLRAEFPQYEEFWQLFVVGLTGLVQDPSHVDLLSPRELRRVGRPEWHLTVAQVHYTTLLHLFRVFELRQAGIDNRDVLIEAFARLCGATDTAYKLLGRCLLKNAATHAWTERMGEQIRREWKKDAKPPSKQVYAYRNCLPHGRARVGHTVPGGSSQKPVLYCTKIGRVHRATDWRHPKRDDFAMADDVVALAWDRTLRYLCTKWTERLIPWAGKVCTAPNVPNVPNAPVMGTLPARAHSADGGSEYRGPSISFSETRVLPLRQQP